MIGQLKDKRLLLDGIDLKTDIYKFSLSGLFDNNYDHYESDLYSDGSFCSNFKVQNKQLVLNGYVKSNNPLDIIYINKLLNTKAKRTLSVEVEGMGILSAEVIPSSFITDKKGFKSCQLIANDPYLYGETKVLNIKENKGTGIRLPITFPIQFYKSNELTESIENKGSVISYPVIKIKGPCRNFIIKNITTNERLQFDIELLTGDELVIDNRPRTRGILLNGVNKIDLKNGNWISCKPGTNEFIFDRISLSTDSLCSIELQSRWL